MKDIAEILEKGGLTAPQIMCGLIVHPKEMEELYNIYKALQYEYKVGGEAIKDIKALESKALGVKLALGFGEQLCLI